jgi:hypothetical protein
MLSEVFCGLARGREADVTIWADLAMHFFAYSILATAIVVVPVECGYALLHLFNLCWSSGKRRALSCPRR